MQSYAFSNVVVIINGNELTGWADGDDVIQVKRLTDSASHKVGAGGSMVVSFSSDRSGEFTFKLQQTSTSNGMLNDLCTAQDFAGGAFTPVSVLVQDLFRQDLAEGSVGYVKKQSEMSRGAMANTQEWTVTVESLTQVFGNLNPLTAIASAVSNLL